MQSIYVVPLFFFVIAFVFSMLGMGGSQLYIPILFWSGMDFKTQAIPLGLLLNVVNSASAAVTYSGKKLVDWKIAMPFGLSMVLSAPVGTWFNINLPTKPIILIFAVFTASAAILMLSGWKPEIGNLSSRNRLILSIGAGSILGFFAGLIGRGGGSFVVPLLYIVGLSPRSAVATSSIIVTFAGISSFFSHVITSARPDFFLWILCIASVLSGSQVGSRFMANRLKSKSVKLIFGWVLLGIALLLIIKDVVLH